MKLLFAFVVFVTATFNFALAQETTTQETPQELRVITRQVLPFVTKENAQWTGFSVELWNAISTLIGVKYQFVEKGNIKEILAGMDAGEGEVAIAAISITAQREEKFDFSQPMFDSGLQIMVRAENETGFNVKQLWGLISGGAMPILLSLLAALMVIPGHLLWFSERSFENSMVSKKYFPGIFQSIWWSTGAAAGQQPDQPRSKPGRFMAWIAILISMVFMTYFQATVTTALTLQQLRGDINGPEDLIGRKVGSTTGSTASVFLKAMNVKSIEFSKVSEAQAALEAKQLDAIVSDAPFLAYYAANEGNNKVRLVGALLKRENYGILFPTGSPLKEKVDAALLKLREDGKFDELYNKWFSVAQ